MSAMRALPKEGLDLRQELFNYQASLVDQAVERAGGDRAAAARLLRTDLVSLERLVRFLTCEVSEATTPAAEAPPVPDLPKPAELNHIEKGVIEITRGAIRRLEAEGLTAKQIGLRLGVNFYFIEKVLRAEHELASCGPKREPEEKPK